MNIICPHCKESINIDDILNDEISKKDRILQSKFDEKLKELKSKEENIDKLVNDKLKEILSQKSNDLRVEISKEIEAENSMKFKILQDELNKKSQKINELNITNAKLEELKRESEIFEAKLKAKSQSEINEKLNQMKESLEEENRLKMLEKDEELKILKRKIDELQSKTSLRNNQIVGEAGEIEIENFLMQKFPTDEINEIKKGQNGADCIHIIKNYDEVVGKIYYESKRAKKFSPSWIMKFKEDINEANADFGILVTEAMPEGSKSIELIDGIWVCDFMNFKIISVILRQNLIDLSRIKKITQSKDEHIKAIYDYLISAEFKNQIETIIINLNDMNASLLKEKNAFIKIWTQREKQIQKMQENVIKMFSSVKSITNSTQDIKILELE